jgi:small-conductance mechanosensitive channel
MATLELNLSFESIFQREYAGNSVQRWLFALAVLLGSTIFLGIVKRIVVLRLSKIAERTDTDLDDLVVDLVRRTARFFLLALGILVAKSCLDVSPGWGGVLHKVVLVAMWLQVGLWGRGLVHFGIQRMIRGKSVDDPARTMGASVLGFIGQLLVWSIVLLLCLESFDVEVKTLLASLGVGGIAVALAAQNVLGDLFASISILLDKPFVVGDAIVLGDFQGTVENIGIKTTRLRSVSGEQIIIGNHDLVSSRVRNFKRLTERRNLFTVGVTYDTPHEKVAAIPKILTEIVTSTPNTRFDHANFKSLGDSALVFEVVYHVLSHEMQVALDVQQQINLQIYARFAREGIEFAYPTQTVHHVLPPGTPLQKELSRG